MDASGLITVGLGPGCGGSPCPPPGNGLPGRYVLQVGVAIWNRANTPMCLPNPGWFTALPNAADGGDMLGSGVVLNVIPFGGTIADRLGGLRNG